MNLVSARDQYRNHIKHGEYAGVKLIKIEIALNKKNVLQISRENCNLGVTHGQDSEVWVKKISYNVYSCKRNTTCVQLKGLNFVNLIICETRVLIVHRQTLKVEVPLKLK